MTFVRAKLRPCDAREAGNGLIYIPTTSVLYMAPSDKAIQLTSGETIIALQADLEGPSGDDFYRLCLWSEGGNGAWVNPQNEEGGHHD